MSLVVACVVRDWRLARTRRMAATLDLISVLLSAVVFFYLAEYVDRGPSYFPFVIAGLTILRLHTAVPRVLQSATGRIGDGSLEILLTGRSRPAVVLIAESAFELLRGLALSSLLVVIAAVVFGADVRLSATALAATALGLLGAAAVLLALTVALLSLLLVLREAGAVSSLSAVLLPVLAGVYFPRDVLPTPVREVASALPLHLPVDLIRAGLVDGELPAGLLATMIAACGASLVVAALMAAPAVRHARGRGRLALE